MDKTKDKQTKAGVPQKVWAKLEIIAYKQYEAGVRFKQPRMIEIQENEDLYNNKVKKASKGRFNVPLPTMPGFVDTLLSKIDDAPNLEFEHTNPADYTKSLKVRETYKKESAASAGRWSAKDRATKRTASTSGVGIFEMWTESDPEYKCNLTMVDPVDFFCDPLGGEHLENHQYLGKDNVFRSESDLDDGVASGIYDSKAVERLKNSATNNDQKRIKELYQNRQNKMRQLGLDPNNFSYVGEKIWSLFVIQLEHKGKRYMMLMDYDTQVAVRCQRLRTANGYAKEDPELYNFVGWHTHPDELNFWSKAPADDIKPVAEAMNILFNQALDNRQKLNFNMRAVDGSIFPDLEQLEWRTDGIVQGDTKQGERSLREGIYEFKTAEINGTVDMINFMDNFVGTKSGITASAMGGAGEKKGDQAVGIYYGDLQQVADRLGLYNKSYSEAWSQLGTRFVLGIKNHMTEDYLVNVMGEDGMKEDEMTRDDGDTTEPFNIKPVGGQAEIKLNEAKKQTRVSALDKIVNNKLLAPILAPSWVVTEYLKAGEYEDDEIQTALNKDASTNIFALQEASKAIQTILAGKKPKPYRAANQIFVMRIVDFATDKVTDEKIYANLIGYAQAHIPIVKENKQRETEMAQAMADQAMQDQINNAAAGKGAPADGGAGADEIPPGNNPTATASRSAITTSTVTPK